MGQYWKLVNLDKREFVHPHQLGAGLKLWEQLATHPGTGAALIVLLAAMPEARGGGDLSLGDNEESAEDAAILKRTIGRWAGNRVAFVGDYAEDGDLPTAFQASRIYALCCDAADYDDDEDEAEFPVAQRYTNISADVARVLELHLNGQFSGTGWRDWTGNGETRRPALAPDMVVRVPIPTETDEK